MYIVARSHILVTYACFGSVASHVRLHFLRVPRRHFLRYVYYIFNIENSNNNNYICNCVRIPADMCRYASVVDRVVGRGAFGSVVGSDRRFGAPADSARRLRPFRAIRSPRSASVQRTCRVATLISYIRAMDRRAPIETLIYLFRRTSIARADRRRRTRSRGHGCAGRPARKPY
jgi:hypothetical protein